MMSKLWILIIGTCLLFSSQALQCPQSVKDQAELVTLTPQCFRSLYQSQKHDGHKLSRIVNQRIGLYRRLLQDIKMNDVEHLKTHPVIKWAQSQSQIFLNIRLSHRHDSPTCSDIRFEKLTTNIRNTQSDIDETTIEGVEQENKQPEVSEQQPSNQTAEKTVQEENNNKSQVITSQLPSKLLFVSECFFTHQKLLFTLDIHFNSTLSKLTVKKQGFGRYTIIGEKKTSQIWINPFTGWKNAGIWTDMRNKYSSDMDKYFELLQEQNSRKDSKPRRKPKSKKDRNRESSGEL